MGCAGLKPRVLKKFLREDGSCPYDQWFGELRDKKTKAIISVRLNRLILGNFGNCRSLGGGLSEMKIDFGQAFEFILLKAKEPL